MTRKCFEELKDFRQKVLGKKYEGQEPCRDWAKDVLEEIADVANITKKHYEIHLKNGHKKEEQFMIELQNIIIECDKFFDRIKRIDEYKKYNNIKVDDTKGGNRPYFDFK